MSYFSVIDGVDVAHFSHPFTLDLFFDINRLDQVVGLKNVDFEAPVDSTILLVQSTRALSLIPLF